MKYSITIIIIAISILFTALALKDRDGETSTISLAGEWDFSLDQNERGIAEKWYVKNLTQKISLPGSLAENNYGDQPNLTTPWVGSMLDSVWFKDPKFAKYRTQANFKPPMWLTPVKYYRGVAWYQKEVTIPAEWKGKS